MSPVSNPGKYITIFSNRYSASHYDIINNLYSVSFSTFYINRSFHSATMAGTKSASASEENNDDSSSSYGTDSEGGNDGVESDNSIDKSPFETLKSITRDTVLGMFILHV